MLSRVLFVSSFLCLSWAGAGLAVQTGTPSAPGQPRSALDGVPGLERPVTFSEARIPLGELVKRIAKETGVSLYADRTTADEPAAVVVTGMPAVRLLNQVARHFDYRWARESAASGPRFRLYQDVKQLQAEEAMRAAARADEQRRLEIVLRAYVKVGQLSDAEYAAQREALEQRPRGAPRPPVEMDQFYRGLRECGDPAKRALARLLGRLTPQDWQALWQGQRLRMYSKPEAGERGLPPDVAQSLVQFRPSTSWDVQRQLVRAQENAEYAESLRQSYERHDRYWAAAQGVRVVVRLNRAAEMGRLYSRERAATSLTAAVVPLVSNPPEGSPRRMAPTQMRVWIWAATTQPSWGYDPPERLAALEKDPVFTTPQPFSPGTPPVPDWGDRLIYGQVADLLPAMARTYGVSFLGDSYRPTPVVPGTAFPAPTAAQVAPAPAAPAPAAPAEGTPPAGGAPPADGAPGAPPPAVAPPSITLGALLSKLSGHFEPDLNRITFTYYRWDRDDKLVLLRDRTWFFDRPKEIPARVTARWSRFFEEQGCLPLDEYATTVAGLTDDQWDSLMEGSYTPSFPPDYHTIPTDETERLVLRLFRALTPVQRQRLERGAPISWTEMTPPQRNLFLSVLEDLSLTSTVPLTRADLAGANLALVARPVDMIRRKQGNRREALTVTAGLDEESFPRIFEDPRPFTPRPGVPPPPPVTYTRYPAMEVKFMVRCGHTDEAVTQVVVPAARR